MGHDSQLDYERMLIVVEGHELPRGLQMEVNKQNERLSTAALRMSTKSNIPGNQARCFTFSGSLDSGSPSTCSRGSFLRVVATAPYLCFRSCFRYQHMNKTAIKSTAMAGKMVDNSKTLLDGWSSSIGMGRVVGWGLSDCVVERLGVEVADVIEDVGTGIGVCELEVDARVEGDDVCGAELEEAVITDDADADVDEDWSDDSVDISDGVSNAVVVGATDPPNTHPSPSGIDGPKSLDTLFLA